MRTSLLVAGLTVLLSPAAKAQGTASTAEEVLETYRRTFSATNGKCSGSDAEEIVVCGRSTDKYRLPLPVEPPPGQRIAGEAPSPVSLTEEETCTNIGHTRGCPSVDFIGIGLMIGQAVAKKIIEEVAQDDD